MDQAGMITPFSEDGLDSILFTKGLVAANELDLNAGIDGETLGMITQFIPQGLRPSGVIEQPDLVVTEDNSP
jgi:hypothetical protein